MVKRREQVLDPSEIAEMIDALPDVRDRALWAAAFHAGMRFGELRALRWEHVDLAASRLHFRECVWVELHLARRPERCVLERGQGHALGSLPAPIIPLLRHRAFGVYAALSPELSQRPRCP
jgi:integrase